MLQMVRRDFNFELSNEDVMPKELFAARRMGQLVDVMHSRAHPAGTSAAPTFHAGPHEGTRIGGIVTDPRLFSVVTMTEVTPIPVPGHSKLGAMLDLDMTAQNVTKLRKLRDPPQTSMHPDRQAHLAQGMWKCLHTWT